MSVGEARFVISATDKTGAAFASVEQKVKALEKNVGGIAKAIDAVDKVAKSVAPVSTRLNAAAESVTRVTAATRSLAEEQTRLQAQLEAQKAAAAGARTGWEEFAGPVGRAISDQTRLAGEIDRVNSALAQQGRAAARASEELAVAVRKEEAAQRRKAAVAKQFSNELLPFAGPLLLEGTKGAYEAGATVQERIAQLQTSGATPDEIARARSDYGEFSRSHAGALESDYLASYKDARVIAPGEAFEMAQLGGRYRVALRNSGISSTDADVGNVMRIMDELGLKSMGDREGFLDNFLKSQQAFGDQIKTETALSAYRNAKQSIYGWSPEFRDKLFPTLLQSSGQQGGTEMMTALNNYIGQHMQLSELKALIGAGFVNNKDLYYEHNKPLLKPGAQLFESDVFKSNIAQWAWDFHDHFMDRKGSTEGKFDDLIAKMPRNMAALIAFMVHNEGRIKRDEITLGKPVGLAAESNASLRDNPVAGLIALKDAIEQFAAAVTSPGMKTVGTALQTMAQGLQNVAATYSEFAKQHPEIASWLGNGATAAGGATGAYLSWKLLSGFGSAMFGGGGAAMTGAATALDGSAVALDGAAAALDAAAVRLGAPASLAPNIVKGAGAGAALEGAVIGGAGVGLGARLLGGLRFAARWSPWTALAAAIYEESTLPPTELRRRTDEWNRAQAAMPGIIGAKPGDESHAYDHSYEGRIPSAAEAMKNMQVSLDPNSKAQVDVMIRVDEGSLLKLITSALAKAGGSLSASVGTSSAGVAPNGPGGIGRM